MSFRDGEPFQFTHPRGVRRVWLGLDKAKNKVSIHAPTRGATNIPTTTKNLNYVSIHAPTRGATDDKDKYIRMLAVSIHAPTRGATY